MWIVTPDWRAEPEFVKPELDRPFAKFRIEEQVQLQKY